MQCRVVFCSGLRSVASGVLGESTGYWAAHKLAKQTWEALDKQQGFGVEWLREDGLWMRAHYFLTELEVNLLTRKEAEERRANLALAALRLANKLQTRKIKVKADRSVKPEF